MSPSYVIKTTNTAILLPHCEWRDYETQHKEAYIIGWANAQLPRNVPINQKVAGTLPHRKSRDWPGPHRRLHNSLSGGGGGGWMERCVM